MEWRAARQVHKARPAHHRCRSLVLGVGAGEHHQTLDPSTKRGEPIRRLRDQTLGALVGGSSRQDQHLVRAGCGKELGVEGAARLPLAAADERQRSWEAIHRNDRQTPARTERRMSCPIASQTSVARKKESGRTAVLMKP